VKNIFRAVAVMHIEIGNRHPLQAVMFERVRCRDGHIIEEAETGGTAPSGMMAGRTNIAKSIFHFT